jgi:flagellar assembly factor FliW
MTGPTTEPLITFVDGLPGFETCRQFVLIESPSLAPFRLVQGLDLNGPSFIAIDPRLVVPDYAVELEGSDRARLEAQTGEPLVWLAIVSAQDQTPTANLRAPLVINPASMRAIQVIPAESRYAVNHPLAG